MVHYSFVSGTFVVSLLIASSYNRTNCFLFQLEPRSNRLEKTYPQLKRSRRISPTMTISNQKIDNCYGANVLSSSSSEANVSSRLESEKTLNELLSPSKLCNLNQMSGTDLAYIGDVVFELFVRSRYVWPSRRTSDLQNIVVSMVRGAFVYLIVSLFSFYSFPKFCLNHQNDRNTIHNV